MPNYIHKNNPRLFTPHPLPKQNHRKSQPYANSDSPRQRHSHRPIQAQNQTLALHALAQNNPSSTSSPSKIECSAKIKPNHSLPSSPNRKSSRSANKPSTEITHTSLPCSADHLLAPSLTVPAPIKLPKFNFVSRSTPARAHPPSPQAPSNLPSDTQNKPANSTSVRSNSSNIQSLVPPKLPAPSPRLSPNGILANGEDEDVPLKCPPPRKARKIRHKKGAAVSTEPTKTKRAGQTSGSRRTHGSAGLGEQSGEESEEESGSGSGSGDPRRLSPPVRSRKRVGRGKQVPADQFRAQSFPTSPRRTQVTSAPLPFEAHQQLSQPLPGLDVSPPDQPSDENPRDSSDLSSLPSDDDGSPSSFDGHAQIPTDAPALAPPVAQPPGSSHFLHHSPPTDSHSSPVSNPCGVHGQRSPPHVSATDVNEDEPSELGDDVCLEYTDFGQDFGVPVTWSESEYDDGHETDETDKFAEFLLMDAEDGDDGFGIEQLRGFRAHPGYAQMTGEMDRSDGGSSRGESELGYMVIQKPELQELAERELEHEDEHEDEGGEGGSEDGATTDSLDSDDHSGLVRYGIEVDDEAASEAAFFDLPPDSALGTLLNSFELAGDVEFFVLPEDGPAPGAGPSEPGPRGVPEITFPVMGTFAADRKDGTSAGRTIIDERQPHPPSPFTGGRVVRYNRFKKLRVRSCAGDSEPSSIGTPKPDGPGGQPADAPVEDFDITAFIRGISSIDDGCSDAEPSCEERGELDDLSRWRRVPMTAFRRRMVARGASEERTALEGAMQSSLGESVSLYEPGRRQKALQAKKVGESVRSSKRARHESGGVGSGVGEERRGVGRLDVEQTGVVVAGFNTPLFGAVGQGVPAEEPVCCVGGVGGEVPMLNLMDGIEGLASIE